MKKWFIFLFAVLALGGFLIKPVFSQWPFMMESIEGQQAKSFELATAQGNQFQFNESYWKGKKTVLFFWATWCPHCRDAMQEIRGRLNEFKETGIDLILVNMGEAAKTVKPYMSYINFDKDVLLDEEGTVANDYQVSGIPTFAFIDQEGKILKIDHVLPQKIEDVWK